MRSNLVNKPLSAIFSDLPALKKSLDELKEIKKEMRKEKVEKIDFELDVIEDV